MLKRVTVTSLALIFIAFVEAVGGQDGNGSFAMPERLALQPVDRIGYPEDSEDMDVLPGFREPPAGYGQAPFYWWVGEKLTKERLLWQLDQLHEAGVQGFSVSYPHSHSDIDVETNKDGFGRWGMTYPSDPVIFSDAWWELWNWFTGECAKRDMGVGLDDYTFCTPGNRQWPDDIAALPELKAYQGKLIFTNKTVPGGEDIHLDLPETLLSIRAYPAAGGRLTGDASVDLAPHVESHRLSWKALKGKTWQVVVVSTAGGFMLHPEHGNEVVARYFQRFEDHVVPANRKGQNFFFQDELLVDLHVGTWSEDLADEFRTRKGYDIGPHLAALRHDIGPKTVKVRLDYWDVVVELAEERYFKPIFDWHWERGLLYGCDNEGRGLNPVAYGDYFRASRWFTAPGNDAPMGNTALVQTKVSSSIAHLYRRPRVWLEAFHSMGWDARAAQIHEATERHYLLGGNLLCLHGLYYTTFGGWWEWAPPDFHFRMPYWPHMKGWLKYVERLSYLLPQGHHVCDVAMVYPVAPLQARNGGKTDTAFEAAKVMFDAGIDFDFIDSQSLARSEIKNGQVRIEGEAYRVLILPDMTAIRFSTIEKARELHRSGGLVLNIGRLPEASDRIGGDDPKLRKILGELFDKTGRNLGKSITRIPGTISKAITRDFVPETGSGHVLHRRAGPRDIYMVMDVPRGEECFFRAQGKVELWDPWTGNTRPLPVTRQTEDGSYVVIPNPEPQSSIIVFSPGEPVLATAIPATSEEEEVFRLDGEWDCELVPTLNNRWGDYRQPPSEKIIGAEAREFDYITADKVGAGWQEPGFSQPGWRTVRVSFGPQFQVLHLPKECDPVAAERQIRNATECADIRIDGKTFSWKPYEYSWRWGVKDQPGSQGYHGLKKNVSDGFLIMGEGGHFFYRTSVQVSEETRATLVGEGRKADKIWIDGVLCSGGEVVLKRGANDILAAYVEVPEIKLQGGPHVHDTRARSAVVLVEQGAGEAASFPLAMRWYTQPGLLAYDVMSGKKTAGCYRFQAPPGLQEMTFSAYGELTMWVDGESVQAQPDEEQADGLRQYSVQLESPKLRQSTVAIRVVHQPGHYAGAAIPEPIELNCGPGKIQTGDWSKVGVLEHYSGGMWYRRSVTLTAAQVSGDVTLDLGRVIATCEVWVNGKRAAVCVTEPFAPDITDYVRPGENQIAILVYNTLSNHYQTIPTPTCYKRTTASGLAGPVQIRTVPSRLKAS